MDSEDQEYTNFFYYSDQDYSPGDAAVEKCGRKCKYSMKEGFIGFSVGVHSAGVGLPVGKVQVLPDSLIKTCPSSPHLGAPACMTRTTLCQQGLGRQSKMSLEVWAAEPLEASAKMRGKFRATGHYVFSWKCQGPPPFAMKTLKKTAFVSTNWGAGFRWLSW